MLIKYKFKLYLIKKFKILFKLSYISYNLCQYYLVKLFNVANQFYKLPRSNLSESVVS